MHVSVCYMCHLAQNDLLSATCCVCGIGCAIDYNIYSFVDLQCVLRCLKQCIYYLFFMLKTLKISKYNSLFGMH